MPIMIKQSACLGLDRRLGGVVASILLSFSTLAAGLEQARPQGAGSERSTDPLIADVDWLNDIVFRYELAGGWFGERDSAQLVISRLSYASGDYGLPLMGSRSGVKLVPVFAEEAPAAKRWAYWNVSTNRFDLWRGLAPKGVRIITHFKRRLDAAPIVAAAVSDVSRAENVLDIGSSLASEPPVAASASASASASAPAPRRPQAEEIAQAWAGGSARSQVPALDAPLFDPPGGEFSPSDFKLRVHLANPNAADAGTIYYSIDNSGWTLYRGEVLVVEAGAEILAFCETADSAQAQDSEPVAAHYTIDPIRLKLNVSRPSKAVPASALSFDAAPSPLMPSVAIGNLDALPDELRTGGHFQILWTLDGSDPLTSGTAFPVDMTEGAGRAQPLPLSSLLTGDATELRIRIAARSSDRRLLLHSEETELRLEIVH
jgi:hypothetical protein